MYSEKVSDIIRVEELLVGVRVYNNLKDMGIDTLKDLCLANWSSLQCKLGYSGVGEVSDAIRKYRRRLQPPRCSKCGQVMSKS